MMKEDQATITKTSPKNSGNGHPAPRPSFGGKKMSGAEIFLRALELEGVEVVFGPPGGAGIKVYDALARRERSCERVLVRHEQGGTHAAEGDATATRR